MKTPMHELLDFELELTRMFDSDERVAMAILDKIRTTRKEMLEKEKEVIMDAYDYGFSDAKSNHDHNKRILQQNL
jgi:hypothetical protein